MTERDGAGLPEEPLTGEVRPSDAGAPSVDDDADLLALVEVTAEHPIVRPAADVAAHDEPTAEDDRPTEWFTFDLDELDRLDAQEPTVERREHHVTAVVVAHDGGTWLPATLTTLAAQRRPVDGVVGVDVASTDDSLARLRASLGEERVVETGANVGFGRAVAAGLQHIDRMVLRPAGGYVDSGVVEWVWLLHDDSAPDADCLDALLLAADRHPGVGVLGPKVLGWHDRRLLLEVGFSVTGSGRRFTGLERREHDQAQHDGDRTVLAVGSAGMLVRRELWERLDGFDPNLPLFRDDLDFCWRAHRAGEDVMVATDAVIHHREASAHGRRADVTARPHRLDREASVHVLLAQAPPLLAPFLAIRLLLGSALQSVTHVIGKDFAGARDEVAAVWSLLIHPGRVHASRQRIARTSVEPASCVRHLRPSAWSQLRAALESAVGRVTTSSAAAASASVSGIDAGPVDEESESLDSGSGWVRRAVLRPSVLLALLLTGISLVALRSLLWGEGVLQGGALLPSPAGASDLWSQYTQAWHDVGPGSSVPGAPYLLVIWALAVPLLGKAPVAVSLMFLLALPLAGWSAYFALRGIIATRLIRIWAGIAYALLPPVTIGISTGRIGIVIAAFALPFAVRSIIRIARPQGTMRRAAGACLIIAVVLAAAPAAWVVLLVAVLVIALSAVRREGRASAPVVQRLALAVLGPLVVLVPWSLHLLAHPVLLLADPGAPIPGGPATPLDVLLLQPGGPVTAPVWAGVGIVLAGLLALLRSDRARATRAAVSVGLLAAAIGIAQVALPVTMPWSTTAATTWPGVATLLLGGSLIVSAALAGDGLRQRFAGADFSLGQPLAVFLAVLAVAAPVVLGASWFADAGGMLRRGPAEAVPAFVAADATSPQAPRTLVLRELRSGEVLYALVNGAGPMLGDADVSPDAQTWAALDPLVADLASGRGGEEVEALAGYGVRYVLMDAGAASDLVPTLDAAPGLRRLSTAGGETLWRVAGDTSRARLVGADATSAVGVQMDGALGVEPYIDQSVPAAGTLVLGAASDSHWSAIGIDADGDARALPTATAPDLLSWSQAFDVPAGQTSRVEVSYDSGLRTGWLLLQLIVFVVLVILALPSRRAEEDFDAESFEELASADANVGTDGLAPVEATAVEEVRAP